MTEHTEGLPRHDYYQTATHVIAAVYLKGYAGEGVKDQVDVRFSAGSVEIKLPDVAEASVSKRKITFSPLYAQISPSESSYRILSTKIELKLAKADGTNWPSFLSSGNTQQAKTAGPSQTTYPVAEIPTEKPRPQRKNWDTLVDEDEEEESKDPNAGGEAALQKLFSTIYKDASDDTRRAMIKSYTESGGTTLSTDWSKIGQESTKVHPPEGMEAKKY